MPANNTNHLATTSPDDGTSSSNQTTSSRPPCPSREPPPPPYTSCGAGRPDKPQDQPKPVFAKIKSHEPLLKVHSFLPPESQAALALVTKKTLSILGPKSENGTPIKPWPLNPETRTKLLKLLDRDLHILVYCSICDLIHGTFHAAGRKCTTNLISKHPDTPPLPGGHGESTSQKFIYPSLPEFNLVHAIMRSYRAGRRDYTELTSVGSGMGVATRGPAELMFRRGAVLERARIVMDPYDSDKQPKLTWMNQRVFPVRPPYLEEGEDYGFGKGVPNLRNYYEIGCYLRRWIPPICQHREWYEEYPFLLTNTPDLLVSSANMKFPGLGLHILFPGYVDLRTRFRDFTIDPNEFRDPAPPASNGGKKTKKKNSNFRDSNRLVYGNDVNKLLLCALYHGAYCREKCGTENQFGVVRSCERCDTDYCFTVVTQEVEPMSECVSGLQEEEKEKKKKKKSTENFLVFTSWKNLGAGISREEDCIWQAHVSRTTTGTDGKKDRKKLYRSSGYLFPYARFGKLEKRPDEYKRHVYYPRLHPSTISCARSD